MQVSIREFKAPPHWTANQSAMSKPHETLMQGRISLVIAHRLSTIEKAGRIVVLKKGRNRRDRYTP